MLFPPVGFLRCPVDGGALKNAVRSSVCGHAFGMQCILAHLVKHETCPVCLKHLDASCLQPAEDLRCQVEELKMRCPEKRCSWVGPTSEVEEHHNGPQCAVEMVACPFCRHSFEVGTPFEAHKDVCEDVIVICQQCLDDMPRKAMRRHLSGCKSNVPEPLQRQQSNLRQQSSVSPVRSLHSMSIHRDVSAMLSPEVLEKPTEIPTGAAGDGRGACDSPPMRSMECSLISEPKSQPADERRGTEPATALPSREASAPSTESGRVSSHRRDACLFAAVGCDGSAHKGMSHLDPAALHLHLMLLVTRLDSMQAENAALRTSHAELCEVVAGQTKTIAHLTSRNSLLQSYVKARAPPSGPSSTLRTSSSEKPKVEEIVKTPVRDSGPAAGTQAGSTLRKSGKDEGRSASSPAAPGRAPQSAAVPLFKPKQPKKPTLANGPPPRRPSESSTTPVAAA